MIKANNGRCCGDLYDDVPEVSLATNADQSEGPSPSNPSRARTKRQPPQEQAQEDVLRCSSIGSLRSKQTLSFDLKRAQSTIAMRRTILERNGPAIEMNNADSVRARAPSSSCLQPSSLPFQTKTLASACIANTFSSHSPIVHSVDKYRGNTGGSWLSICPQSWQSGKRIW